GLSSWRSPLLDAVGVVVLRLITALTYWVLDTRAEANYQLSKRMEIDNLEFRYIFRFNRSYWYVVVLCFTFYSAIFPFRTFAIDFFTNKILAGQGVAAASEMLRVLAHEKAGFFNSLLPFSAMI